IGKSVVAGLGTSGDVELGAKAFELSRESIQGALKGLDVLFLVGCLGGGTASAGVPYLAQIAKEMGIMTVIIVTSPFLFEGTRKVRLAQETLTAMKPKYDTVMVIPNDKLMNLADEKTTMMDAFTMVDCYVGHIIKAYSRLMIFQGLIPVDFQDIRKVMSIPGEGRIGYGFAEGKGKILNAFDSAMNCPLLGSKGLSGAPGVLIAIHGGENLNLLEIYHAVRKVTELAHQDAYIVFGSTVEKERADTVEVCLIATGMQSEELELIASGVLVKGKNKREEQAVFDLKLIDKGKFAKDEPTMYNGVDLDIPAFLRKKIGQ
ncbi:MAG: cell division protein FtsZ, partial [Chlamydiota bacterium]|nr:cell division protein FtsZ [Chlamydiota bacterium]